MYEFISGLELERIVEEHVNHLVQPELNARELIGKIFGELITFLLDEMKLYLNENSKFNEVENVYDFFVNGEKKAEDYLAMNIEEEDVTEDELDMLKGIFTALRRTLDEVVHDEENPIIKEKHIIIDTYVETIKDELSKYQEDAGKEYNLPVGLDGNIPEDIKNYLMDALNQAYETVKEKLENALIKLNTFEQRDQIKFYYDIVIERYRTIETYTSIVFENAALDTGVDLTAKYIYPLQEVNNKLKAMQEKMDMEKSLENIPVSLDLIKVKLAIEEDEDFNRNLNVIAESVETIRNETLESAEMYLHGELTKTTSLQINRLKKASLPFEMLSCFVLELFEDSLQCLNQHDTTTIEGGIESKIIKGVEDTIHLKYASLKDKDEDYHLKKKEDFLTYSEKFIEYRADFARNTRLYIDACVKGSKVEIEKSQSFFEKISTVAFDENLRQDLNYISTDILFEIRTLEDLIHHSIDRLKESQDQVCHEFAACVDELYDRILVQLKRSEILQLKAKPHDGFNGKVHEVLMTEKAEGFAKGEIIRSQNSGYIYDKRVLQRVSVIVAR